MNRAIYKISTDIDPCVLQTLVPVNALTADHLHALLRNQSIEAVCQGETLFTIGEYDRQNVYLLSGEVEAVDAFGATITLDANSPRCRYPLFDHQPRMRVVKALTDCSIIRFDADQLDAMLAWDQASRYIMLDISAQRDLDEDADWMLTLLKSNMFYKVPPMNIRHIINKFEPHYVSAGEAVIRQGELGDCCYFIKEGLAGVYQSVDDKAPSQLVAELEAGLCFGEDALLNEAARNATIIMHSNGVLMRLNKQDFFTLLKPPAADKVNLHEAKIQIENGSVWIDVRTQAEYEHGHSVGAVNMPLDLLKLKSRMLDKHTHYITFCNSGRRSEAAAYLLAEDGFNVSVLAGGYDNYSVAEQAYFEHLSLES